MEKFVAVAVEDADVTVRFCTFEPFTFSVQSPETSHPIQPICQYESLGHCRNKLPRSVHLSFESLQQYGEVLT